ncbi:MAG: tetratricopeptide repeat protein [Candidatus Acidiferrales bacterium]
MSHEQIERAWKLIEQACRAQMDGELDHAVELYKDSLQVFPTAEAHTYLGWTYHFQGRVRDAIDECKRAIEIDPNFGNPYNDIGAYLISLGRHDEAIPWLEHAIQASRYEPRHFPYFNLGRIYYAKGMINRARQYFQEALCIDPGYAAARQAVENIRRMLN